MKGACLVCLNTEQPGQSQGGVKDMACIAGWRGDYGRGNGLVQTLVGTSWSGHVLGCSLSQGREQGGFSSFSRNSRIVNPGS